jgi:hypothetical protein
MTASELRKDSDVHSRGTERVSMKSKALGFGSRNPGYVYGRSLLSEM